MPHKRAKKSVREQLSKQRGLDLAPGKDELRNEPIPKSASRVLNAARIRENWNMRKRKLQNDGEDQPQNKRRKSATSDAKLVAKLKIKPGESIQHFNRRVEDDMRPLVRTAMQTTYAITREARKKESNVRKSKLAQIKSKPTEPDEGTNEKHPIPQTDKHANRPKEFQEANTSAPRCLNDIAQAPPELKKLPTTTTRSSKRDGVLSMAQKSMMEQEREKAIVRYRELKANRRSAQASEIEVGESE